MDIRCKCGSVNDFIAKPNGPHVSAYCNKCGQYIQHIQQPNFLIWFGKFKGLRLHEMTSKEQTDWLRWAYNNATILKDHHKFYIAEFLHL